VSARVYVARMRNLSLVGIALLALATPACGDDGKGEGADAGTDGTADTGETAEGPETETSGSSMEGDGDGDGGDGDGDGGDGDGDGDGGDGDGDGDGEGGDGDGDPKLPCVDHETQDDCEADPACQAVIGQMLQLGGLGSAACLLPAEFIGCIDMMGCDDALTWFCVGPNEQPYLVNNGCGPEGAQMCQPMIPNPQPCP
jgi:hypothetical protein